jgi:hypothetical protein
MFTAPLRGREQKHEQIPKAHGKRRKTKLMPDGTDKAIERLTLYLARVKIARAAGDRTQLLADLAELAEIARRLWDRLAAGK